MNAGLFLELLQDGRQNGLQVCRRGDMQDCAVGFR
jgi:hypothetical protein